MYLHTYIAAPLLSDDTINWRSVLHLSNSESVGQNTLMYSLPMQRCQMMVFFSNTESPRTAFLGILNRHTFPFGVAEQTLMQVGVCLYEFLCGVLPFGDTAEGPYDIYE